MQCITMSSAQMSITTNECKWVSFNVSGKAVCYIKNSRVGNDSEEKNQSQEPSSRHEIFFFFFFFFFFWFKLVQNCNVSTSIAPINLALRRMQTLEFALVERLRFHGHRQRYIHSEITKQKKSIPFSTTIELLTWIHLHYCTATIFDWWTDK